MANLKEEEYVHKVYNEIASHFSETRYKPWPIVTDFLMKRSIGSIGLDVGCGNGKYLNVNPNLFLIGSDRSSGLIQCAHDIDSHHNVLVADGMHLPHKDNTFDFAISIAVVHHWTTRERRVEAIAQILSKLKNGGEALIYCWALEQSSSRRGYHDGMQQDVLVPWVLQDKTKKAKNAGSASTSRAQNSLDKPNLSGVPLVERAQFIANWKKELEEKRSQEQEKVKVSQSQNEKKNTKYRYYHLYREGELEEDCINAGGVILARGYEKDNWYVIVQKA